jgi:mono/diheme cytochrome c family protein
VKKLFSAAALLLLCACRGDISHEPPALLPPKVIEAILPVSSMNWQPKYHAQGQNEFWEDGRDARTPPEGTVARGQPRDTPLYTGLGPDGKPLDHYPLAVTLDLTRRGRDRFNIYCGPCHDRTGSGQGLVPKRGWIPPPSFHQPRILAYTPGDFFQVITNGIRTMPSYARQIPPEDRWAIISYVQSLQVSEHATLEDVPAAQRNLLK